jgi:hypothetical protein
VGDFFCQDHAVQTSTKVCDINQWIDVASVCIVGTFIGLWGAWGCGGCGVLWDAGGQLFGELGRWNFNAAFEDCDSNHTCSAGPFSERCHVRWVWIAGSPPGNVLSL